MYYVIVIPPKGRIISLFSQDVYTTDKLVAYYTELGCQVTVQGIN